MKIDQQTLKEARCHNHGRHLRWLKRKLNRTGRRSLRQSLHDLVIEVNDGHHGKENLHECHC